MSALTGIANISSILNMTQKPVEIKRVRVISYVVIGSLSVFSNALLCVVLVRNRQMFQRAYNIIIFSLGIIDMLTGLLMVTVIVGTAADTTLCTQQYKGNPLLDAILCGWMAFLFGKISILFAMSLALERWFAVVRPIQYRYKFKKRRVYFYIFIIIVTPLACKIHTVLVNSTQNIISKSFVVAEVILTCLLPMLITWLTYVHVWYHCRASSSIRKTGSEIMKKKLLRMCAIAAIFVTVCWLPTEIHHLIYSVVTERKPNIVIINTLDMFSMGNSIVNPWIYYFTNQEYKKKFNSILKNLTERFKCVDKCHHLRTTRTADRSRVDRGKTDSAVTIVRICHQ